MPANPPTDDAGVLRAAITDAALNLADAIGINRTDEAGATSAISCLDRLTLPRTLGILNQ